MTPLKGRPSLGVGMTIGSYLRRHLARRFEIRRAKNIHVIVGAEHGIAADPFDLRTRCPHVFGNLALEILEGAWGTDGIRHQTRQHDEGLHADSLRRFKRSHLSGRTPAPTGSSKDASPTVAL